MMIAKKKNKSHAQRLLDMAKDEAKIADAIDAGARRPSPRDIALGRSLPQEVVGLRTSENSPPSASSAPMSLKSRYDDDDERSGGSSLDNKLLSYPSGDIPPLPPPSLVAMVPASARTESNRSSVEATMMQATTRLGDASRRTILVADMPADAAPDDRAGVPSQAQALFDTAEAAAEANINHAGDPRSSHLGIACGERPGEVISMPRGEDDREERHRHKQRERRHQHRHTGDGEGEGEGRERHRHRHPTADGGVSDRDRHASLDGGGGNGGASDGLVRSLPQEATGRRTSDDSLPSEASAILPPKSHCPWNPAPSALPAPHAQYADLPPQPSAPPLELLMEDGFFGGPTDDHPTSDAPFTRDEGHARMTPFAEARVVLMPVCEAVRTKGPTPAQDEEDNDALANGAVRCRKFMKIGVAFLVLVVLGTLIGVVVMSVKQDNPVTTSSPSSKPTNSPTLSPSSQPIDFPTTSSPSTSSTTTSEKNAVSESSTDFMLVDFF